MIKDGTVVTPQGTCRADLAAAEGKIAALGLGLRGRRELSAAGMLVLPGAIDAHTHMELPVSGTRSSDDFASGTAAAACGGVTTIGDFTVATGADSLAAAVQVRRRQARRAAVDYALHAEVVGWQPGWEDQFAAAVECGVVSFKFYTAYGESGRRTDYGTLHQAFSALAALGATAMVHCEDEEIIRAVARLLTPEDRADMATLARARPPVAESLAVRAVGHLAHQTGVRLHIAHLSSALGLQAVADARRTGARITAETCPQYLLLDADLYHRDDGHLYSASPPLRTAADRAALWSGLARGEIELVATDHCPFTRAQKAWQGSFADLPYGLPGVETLLPLLYSEGVAKGRISLAALCRLLAEGPARALGLYPRKGVLAVGSDADVAVLDPKAEWRIAAADLHMSTDFSPFQGRPVVGKVAATVSRGRVVYADGRFQGEEGWGEFIAGGR
ncbi:MAG: dihydropyrimidinase [Candidatus Bipolaricaulaceae bacterium]